MRVRRLNDSVQDSQYFNYGILLRICGHRDTYHLAKVLSQFPQPYSTQHEYLLEARRVIHGSIINWTRYQKLYQEGDHIQRAILEVCHAPEADVRLTR